MSIEHDSTVVNDTRASTLPNGVRSVEKIAPEKYPGCTVFVHYNGPTDQLSAVSMGMAVLDPGGAPHEPHRHPEEEFMLVASGTGEIECDGATTKVGPGSVMYCAGGALHGIVNTGVVPMTFYWSKWTAKGLVSRVGNSWSADSSGYEPEHEPPALSTLELEPEL